LLGPRTSLILGVLVAVSLAVLVLYALVIAPPDANQGDSQRLMYVHVPTAWIAYLAFGITSLASVLYLIPKTRSLTWDRLAGASAEVGVVFIGLALFTGSVWGRPTWGVWWTWDARLVTTAVLFFLYLGYLALRRLPGTFEQRAKRSAIAALIAFVDVPIVHMSVQWWRTLHQQATVLRPDPQIEGVMAFTLLWAVIAFTMFFVWLVDRRYRVAALEDILIDAELDIAIAERVASGAPQTAGATR
jgi:heme exporter protein C